MLEQYVNEETTMNRQKIHRIERKIRRSTTALQRSAQDTLEDLSDGASAFVDAATQAPAFIKRTYVDACARTCRVTAQVAGVAKQRPYLLAVAAVGACAALFLAQRRRRST
ncbi:hypothetical protein [Phenylobacterium immobile]|uniref:hypothetical protein n=1 Tax=Phenylobacterium immobile TaxID=21 RepID=UPI000AC03331|nr:hypothetical protein [Phenylobacterium immobile]